MILGWVALALAAPPFVLMLWNLWLFRTPALASAPHAISVLIPARNEEANIGDAVAAVLASEGVLLEVVVLVFDDGREPVVIHAMSARRQYRDLLRERS